MRTKTTHFKSRMALYSLVLIACFLLQFSRGTRINIIGTSLDILPFFIAAIALYENEWVGAAFGFAAGMLTCISAGSAEGLLALYYGLCGLGLGYFASRYMRRVLPSTILCGAAIFMAKILVIFCFYYVLVYKAANLEIFKYAAIQLLASMVAAIPLHYLIRKISTKFEDLEN